MSKQSNIPSEIAIQPFTASKRVDSLLSRNLSPTGIQSLDEFIDGEILTNTSSTKIGFHPLGHRKTAVVIVCLGSLHHFQYSFNNTLAVYLDSRNTAQVYFYVCPFRFELNYLPIFNEFNRTLKEENPKLSFTLLHFQSQHLQGIGYYHWIMQTLFDGSGYQQILFIEVLER